MASASYRRIEVRPLTGALGAEIFGADLSRLDDEMFTEIHRAFLDHLVVFCPDQRLTPDQHKNFARRFGPIYIHPMVEGMQVRKMIRQFLGMDSADVIPVDVGREKRSDSTDSDDSSLPSSVSVFDLHEELFTASDHLGAFEQISQLQAQVDFRIFQFFLLKIY